MLISQFKRVSLLHVLRARVPYMKHLSSSSLLTTHCTGGVPHTSRRTKVTFSSSSFLTAHCTSGVAQVMCRIRAAEQFFSSSFFLQLTFFTSIAQAMCRIRVAVRILRSKILLVAEPRLAKQETLGSIFAFCASIAS